jgi:hypothetical protein
MRTKAGALGKRLRPKPRPRAAAETPRPAHPASVNQLGTTRDWPATSMRTSQPGAVRGMSARACRCRKRRSLGVLARRSHSSCEQEQNPRGMEVNGGARAYGAGVVHTGSCQRKRKQPGLRTGKARVRIHLLPCLHATGEELRCTQSKDMGAAPGSRHPGCARAPRLPPALQDRGPGKASATRAYELVSSRPADALASWQRRAQYAPPRLALKRYICR